MRTICCLVAAALVAPLIGCSTPPATAAQPVAIHCEANWSNECPEKIYKTFVVSGNCRVEDDDDILKEHASRIAEWEPEYFSDVAKAGNALMVSYVLPDRYFAKRHAVSIDVFLEGSMCSRVEAGLIVR